MSEGSGSVSAESGCGSHRYFALIVVAALAAGCLWGAARSIAWVSSPLNWSFFSSGLGKSGQSRSVGDAEHGQHTGSDLNAALGRIKGQAEAGRWLDALRYRLLGDLGPQVREGCPGWLFYRDGLEPSPGHSGAFAQRLVLMRSWAAQLRAKGVPLLVVTVPDKSRVETEHLCGLSRSPAMQAYQRDWQRALGEANVPFVDALKELKDLPQAFYRTDVHLGPAGADALANEIAALSLARLGGKGTQKFTETPGPAPGARMGDLIVLAGLEKAGEGWRPQLEQVGSERIEPVHTEGLLEEGPAAEVLLLGDSNGLRSQFAARLGRDLGREVWNQSQDGGYFSGAMLAGLARRAYWPSSLRLVIWQFSELSLSLPLSPQEAQALANLP